MPKRKVSSVNPSFGLKLKEYRDERGFTQQEVADLINLNRTTYTKYETGVSEPSYEIFLKICEVLEVKPNDLLAVEGGNGGLGDGNRLTRDEFEILMQYRVLSKEQKKEFQKLTKDFLSDIKNKLS